MLLDGHVINGQIVLDSPAQLPEGSKVRVELVTARANAKSHSILDIPPVSVGAILDIPRSFADIPTIVLGQMLKYPDAVILGEMLDDSP